MGKFLKLDVSRFLYVVIFTTSINIVGQCQQWQWADNIVSPNEFGGSITTTDNNNNTIVTLPFRGQINVGNTNLNSNSSKEAIAVVKYNAQGQVVWANKITSSLGLSIEDIYVTTDEVGNVYIGGHFFQQLSIDNESLMSPDGRQNIYLCRINANGSLAWIRQFGSPTTDNEILMGLSCHNGQVYAMGYFNGALNNTDDGVLATVSGNADEIFLLKIDCAAGFTAFQRVIGYTCSTSPPHQFYFGYAEAGNLLGIDGEDNIYIVGYFSGCFNIGGITSHITVNSGSKVSFFIAKYNAAGDLIWAKDVPSSDNDFVSQLALDNDGSPYITGSYVKGITLSDALKLEESNVTPRSFLAKFSKSGDPVWLKRLSENDVSPRIAVSDCGVFITGGINGSQTMDEFSAPQVDGTSAPLIGDIYVAKYAHDGEAIWIALAAGVGMIHGSVGKGISAGSNGQVYLSGYTGGSLNFSGSAITLTGSVPSGGGNADSFFLASIQDNAMGLLSTSPNRTTICKGETIRLKAPFIFGKYSWQKDGVVLASNLPVISVSEAGHYTVSVSGSGSACASTASIDITVIDLLSTPVISGDTQFCEGATSLLSTTASGTYQWRKDGTDIPGATSGTYLAQSTGDYSLVIGNSATCTAVSNTLHLDVQHVPVPDVMYEGNTFAKGNNVITFCEGSDVRLFTRDQGGSYDYQWYKDNLKIDGETHSQWTIQQSGSYQLEIQEGACAARSVPLFFQAVAKPVLLLNPNDVKTICAGGTEIRVPQEDGVIYRWSDGVEGSTRIVDRPGTYSIVASRDGCTTEGVVQTKLADRLFVPNVITPGNDDKNEYFVVEGISANAGLSIFNRWGQLVFHTTNYENNWNGRGADPGTYFYSLQKADTCGNTYKGWVELVR
ncbi:hypothetical protein WSM22_37710 [Cytophagales bacterium WSM2-2]|nr:hypothetical protein WSM22_37710 [Cytophagales bacterium WSM2-2]